MRTPIADRVGKVFGRWTVLSVDQSRRSYVMCRCACGKEVSVFVSSLTTGHSVSCGCHRVEYQRADKTKHGHADLRNGNVTRAYRCWTNMKTRCYNPKSDDYHNYGGRGVIVCTHWLHSFENFLEDMGEPPDGKSLDREKTNGNYEKGNCRWSTPKEQAYNRRGTIRVTYKRLRYNLAALESKTGINRELIAGRLRNGWTVERAVETPVRGRCSND